MDFRNIPGFPALCLGASFVVLSGCVARGPVAPAPAGTETRPAVLSFEAQLAALPEGGAQHFTESPFGPAFIEAGPHYLSGLGNQCRTIVVTRGTQRHRHALCKEKSGTWRLVPSIFEGMPQ